jgi:REP element-mobilizing transposase RayT
MGAVARQCWIDIPLHSPHVGLDEFVVMPNHVHGILVINSEFVAAGNANMPAERFSRPVSGSIPTIVRSYKSATTKLIHGRRGYAGFPVWQRNYYEHVIRNQEELAALRQYIVDNPRAWLRDEEYRPL